MKKNKIWYTKISIETYFILLTYWIGNRVITLSPSLLYVSLYVPPLHRLTQI